MIRALALLLALLLALSCDVAPPDHGRRQYLNTTAPAPVVTADGGAEDAR